jgi:2-keto-4-pentenoate hydratase/2-oxohepta-3-ene-1,7-dioic acid hydratase in catechol pathway
MHLVTYDRGGARRLGAWVEDSVVDLPDAVGHPAFPTTMEALVARNGGTTLEAATAALAHPDARDCVVPNPRLLVPLLPNGPGGSRPVFGSGDSLPLGPAPGGATFEMAVACIVGRAARHIAPAQARRTIFGYTIASTWSIDGKVVVSLGPCVATADEFDPAGARLISRVDGETWLEWDHASARWSFPQMISRASRKGPVRPGELFASYGSGGGPNGKLRAGSVVELEVDGIGVLRNRVAGRD